MNGSDAGTSQHCIGSLRNHWHIDADSVALANAACFERVSQLTDVGIQLLVANMFVVVWLIAFPYDGSLFGALVQVTIDAIVSDVEFGPFKPVNVGIGKAAGEYRAPGLMPMQ